MTFIVTAGLSGIVVTKALDQSDNQVVNSCQNASSNANSHTSGILKEGHITAIVQSGFNAPMGASGLGAREQVKPDILEDW